MIHKHKGGATHNQGEPKMTHDVSRVPMSNTNELKSVNMNQNDLKPFKKNQHTSKRFNINNN